MTKRLKPNTTKEDPTVKVAKITQVGVVVGLIITALIAPIVVTIANKVINADPTSTPTFTSTTTVEMLFSSTETQTPVLNITPVATVVQGTFPPPTTNTPDSPIAEIMNVQLNFSSSSGKAPLTVNFNAKGSYVSRSDGTILTCAEKNVCSYTWDVRAGSTSISEPVSGDGVFSYTFRKKGGYLVVVYVCRGAVCSFSAASISVK